MCGISFRKANAFSGYFATASHRGTDGFGVVDSDLTIDRRMPEPTASSHQEALDKILLGKKGFVLLHHRKKSIGGLGIEHTHPFKGKRFILIQNGSSDKVKNWGDVMWGASSRSDTYFLHRLIESQCDSLESVYLRLVSLSKVDKLGVVIVVDRASKRILYFSDGARSFHFALSPSKKYIERCGSLVDGDSVEYKNEGFMVWDFTGKIIQNGIEKLNVAPVKPSNWNKKKDYSSLYEAQSTKAIRNSVQTSLIDYTDIQRYFKKARDGEISYECARNLKDIETAYQQMDLAENDTEYFTILHQFNELVKNAFNDSMGNSNLLQQSNEIDILSNYSFE